MPTDDFMISMTKIDFDVDLISTCGESALFAAFRKGGAERVSSANGPWKTHVMGVWHFVAVTGQGSNLFQTRQWHIPRYVMAREMAQRKKVFEQFGDRSGSPIIGEIGGLPTRMSNPEKLEVHLGDGLIFLIDPEFTRKLQADIPLLEKASGKVRERAGEFFIPRLKTAAGHPVQSSSRELLEAIAFEKLTRPRMSAGNFGIYSAFCTYRDFDMSIQAPDSMIRGSLEGQFEYNPEEIPAEIHELFLSSQHRLLAQPIWGRGIDMQIDDAVPILAEGMAKLTRAQRVQFILMNGMHSAGLFLPLATLLGLCDFDEYAHSMCKAWQPDSPEEQERRKETAYIKLFGDILRSTEEVSPVDDEDETEEEDQEEEEYPELGALEDCPICGRENNPDEFDTCEHHWAVMRDEEIDSNDPKFSEFESEWDRAVEKMNEILDAINENSSKQVQIKFDKILDSYGFSDYAPILSASSAFTELVPCFVGEERAGGLGGMGLSLEKTIFLENSDKIDDGIKKIGHLVNELSKQFLSDS